MCYHIIIINKKHNDLTEIFEKILSKMERNNDGFALVAWADKTVVFRTLNPEAFKEKLMSFKKAKALHIHFRAATSGAVNHENIHCWRIGRYYVSHNGIIPFLPNKSKDSDTLVFLKDRRTQKILNEKHINLQDLANHVGSASIDWGRIFLTSADWKELICVAASSVYIQKIGDVLTFSNDKLDLKRTFFGLRFSVPTAEISSKVFRFSIDDMKVAEECEIKIRYAYSYFPEYGIKSRPLDDYVEISPKVWVKKSLAEKTPTESEREPGTSIKTWHWWEWGGDKHD